MITPLRKKSKNGAHRLKILAFQRNRRQMANPTFISDDLKTQWQDHFHMRDQSLKSLQFSIAVFGGVIALSSQKDLDCCVVAVAFLLVSILCGIGAYVSWRHSKIEKIKFEMIEKYEKKLGLYKIVRQQVEKYKKLPKAKASTSIIFAHVAVSLVSLILSLRYAEFYYRCFFKN